MLLLANGPLSPGQRAPAFMQTMEIENENLDRSFSAGLAGRGPRVRSGRLRSAICTRSAVRLLRDAHSSWRSKHTQSFWQYPGRLNSSNSP
jgi:hypothetical protein